MCLRSLWWWCAAGLCPGKRTYLLGIKAACRVGDVDEAVRLADDMEERHPGVRRAVTRDTFKAVTRRL